MNTPLLVALLLFASPAVAQMQPTQPTAAELSEKARASGLEMSKPFKGATTILLHTTDSADVALKKFARVLVTNGYEPDKLDVEIGYLTTKGKHVGDITPAVYEYKAVSSSEPGGSLLTITGSFTAKISAFNSMTVPMAWAPGNLLHAKHCFVAIEAIASAYAGGRLGYATKPERPVLR